MGNQQNRKKVRKAMQELKEASEFVEVTILIGFENNPDGTVDHIYEHMYVDPINHRMMVDDSGSRFTRECGHDAGKVDKNAEYRDDKNYRRDYSKDDNWG